MTRKPLTGAELNGLVAGLNKLSRNLWWSWDQEAQDLFQELSPRAWQNLYHNAAAILREVSEYELRVRLQDADFEQRARTVLQNFEEYLACQNTWGQVNAPQLLQNPVAYFSAEFGFHESLPISAGGLGILAGDHAKSASDLGLGFVGVGLFYREGYFQQAIDSNNWQTEFYNLVDPENVPLEPVLDADGQPLVCDVEIDMNRVFFQVWRVNVGRVPVYLLDANRPENAAAFPRFDRARLWRRQHDARHAGNPARHRRRPPAAQARRATVGLSHERGPRGLPDAGIDPRKTGRRTKFCRRARRDPGAMHFHHPHAGGSRT